MYLHIIIFILMLEKKGSKLFPQFDIAWFLKYWLMFLLLLREQISISSYKSKKIINHALCGLAV